MRRNSKSQKGRNSKSKSISKRVKKNRGTPPLNPNKSVLAGGKRKNKKSAKKNNRKSQKSSTKKGDLLGKKILKKHMMSGGADDVAYAVPQGPEYDDLEGYIESSEFEKLQECNLTPQNNISNSAITLCKKPTCDYAPDEQREHVKLYYIDHDSDYILYLWVGKKEEGHRCCNVPYLFSTSLDGLDNELIVLSFVKGGQGRGEEKDDYEGQLDLNNYNWIFNSDALERFIDLGEQPADPESFLPPRWEDDSNNS